MSSYWLIYTYTDELSGPRAIRFDDPEEIQSWINERGNIKVLDCVPCSEDEEEEE